MAIIVRGLGERGIRRTVQPRDQRSQIVGRFRVLEGLRMHVITQLVTYVVVGG